jgi:hypothetical protein
MGQRQLTFASFIIICLSLIVFQSHARNNQQEKHVEVALRMVGHQMLLAAGDSTSRVLPIRNEDGLYRVEFDTEFGFNPDHLTNVVKEVFMEAEIARGQIVEVQECVTGDIVYSYEIQELDTTDFNACSARSYPEACYSFLFTFTGDEYQAVALDASDVANQEAGAESTMNMLLVALLFVIVIVMFFLLWRRWKKAKIDPNLIPLGDYFFDKRNTELIIQGERIELSSKESDLLMLLYTTVNMTVERDVILNRVWGDEGDYVGRTLDVFISKLRKKLEADANVKIVNIRGVGYKLVANI